VRQIASIVGQLRMKNARAGPVRLLRVAARDWIARLPWSDDFLQYFMARRDTTNAPSALILFLWRRGLPITTAPSSRQPRPRIDTVLTAVTSCPGTEVRSFRIVIVAAMTGMGRPSMTLTVANRLGNAYSRSFWRETIDRVSSG